MPKWTSVVATVWLLESEQANFLTEICQIKGGAGIGVVRNEKYTIESLLSKCGN